MGLAPLKEFRHADGVTGTATDPTRIVEDQSARSTAHVMKDIHEPLNHALGIFATEQLQVSGIAVRKRDTEKMHSDAFTAFAHVGLPKIHLCFAGMPNEFQRSGGRRRAAPLSDVSTNRRIGPGEIRKALLETVENTLGGMMLLVPLVSVFRQPRVNGGLVGVQL